jgi:uncharacterized membrane protein
VPDLYILAVLCFLVAAAEALVRYTRLRVLGAALLVIVLTALVANLGVLPTGSTEANPVPVYEGIFAYVAPVSIFWLLLPVSLRDIWAAGGSLIALFLIGSVATTIGVTVGLWSVDALNRIGPNAPVLGGMFVGTYTGGSVNFNAVALSYDVMRDGVLYSGAVAVDNIVTAVWMVATLAIPRALAPVWRRAVPDATVQDDAAGSAAPRERTVDTGEATDTESLHPLDLGLITGLGIAAVWIANETAAWLDGLGVPVPSIIVLTVFALVLAQIPAVARLRGARALGMFAVYLFLAVIGAFCDVAALGALGALGPVLLVFASIVVGVHGALTVGAGWLMRADLDDIAVASQANVGGGTSALAVARSIGRPDLVLPAVLIGALGNALGTFLGFWAAASWLPMVL